MSEPLNADTNILKKAGNSSFLGNIGVASKKAMLSGTVLAVIFFLFATTTKNFLSSANLVNLLWQVVTYSILGFGLTFCLICGGTDLSAGSVMMWAGVICVWSMQRGVPMVVAILLALGIGVMTGIINGFTIEVLGIVPFIATLATQWVYRGLGNVWTNGSPLYLDERAADGSFLIPETVQKIFNIFGSERMWKNGMPWSVLVAVIYGIILAIILSKSRVGRQIYACGSNLEAAKLSGVNTVGTRMFAYCVSGFSAAVAGILLTSRMASAQVTAGQGSELYAIAAAVLGGVSNNGGEGAIANVVIGALIMGVVNNGMSINRVGTFWQNVVSGLLLAFACAIEARRYRKST